MHDSFLGSQYISQQNNLLAVRPSYVAIMGSLLSGWLGGMVAI
jgi:hypothetical protein